MKRNRTLEAMITPWEKLARILSRDYGVEVRAEGFTPCYDGKVIRLPCSLGDTKSEDPGFFELIRGVCDHEIGHAIEEQKQQKASGGSTFDVVRKCRNEREKGLLNAIEDIRSERASAETYPGMGSNLVKIQEWAARHSRVRSSRGELTRDPWHTITSAIYLKGQGQAIDYLPEEFRPVLEEIAPEIEEAKTLSDIEGSFQLMKRILTKLADMKDDLDDQKAEADEKAEKGDESSEDRGEGGSSSDQGGKEGEDEKGDQGDQGDDQGEGGESSDGEGEEEGEGSGSKGQESDEKDSQDGSGARAAPSPSGDPDRSMEGDFESMEGTSSDSPRMTREELEKAVELFDSLEHTEPNSTDVFEALKAEIEERAKTEAREYKRYVPDPAVKAQDRFFKSRANKFAADEYRRAKEVVRKQISGLRSKLIQLLRARSQGRICRDQERGNLDTSVLYSLKTGNKRVFTTTIKGEVIDTAVEILVDQSGSMGMDGKVEAAKLTAVALGEALDALNIPFEMLGFSNFDSARGDRRGEYDRWLPLKMEIFKSFDESYKRVKERTMNIHGSGENTDGEAVYYAAERLARRPEARKILFVLSDGNPQGGGRNLERHLRQVVTTITKAGIEVFGFGIKTDAVLDYYNKKTGAESIVINDVSELAKVTFRILRDKLLKRVS